MGHGLAVGDGGEGEEGDFTPFTATIVERPASLGERAVPACLRPARSSALSVVSIPYCPASSEWFEAVLQASQPIARIDRASPGGVRKLG